MSYLKSALQKYTPWAIKNVPVLLLR